MNRYVTAHGIPGEVVTASVSNPLENPNSRGKIRPVILVRRDGGRWWVMGLTTNPAYANGRARTPVRRPYDVGLNAPGYLWGDRLTALSVLDIERHLGWVDAALAADVILQAALPPRDAAALVLAAGGLTDAA